MMVGMLNVNTYSYAHMHGWKKLRRMSESNVWLSVHTFWNIDISKQ